MWEEVQPFIKCGSVFIRQLNYFLGEKGSKTMKNVISLREVVDCDAFLKEKA